MGAVIERTESSELFENVYDQLRALAARHFRRQPASVTLQPTALVHEVYMRLAHNSPGFKDSEHFMAVAATAMRQIVVDQARRRNAVKRGGQAQRVTLSDVIDFSKSTDDVIEIDALLTRLTTLHPRQAQVVELRIFAGMTVPEVSKTLKVSVATVEKDWRQARAWMRVALDHGPRSEATRSMQN